MNIRSSFSILLNLLFLSAIQCYHWDGNTMYDLEYQGSSFDTEAASWTSSIPLVTAGVNTTQCDSNRLLGGFNIMNQGQWSRVYSNLPSHNTITFQGKFFMIDNWGAASELFDLWFDNAGFPVQSISSNYANYTTDKCGNSSYQDLDPMTIYVTAPHTATTFKFRMVNYFTGTPDLKSVGFRDIIMTFSTQSSGSSFRYCGVTSGYPLTGTIPACSCGAGTSMTFPNSGVCDICDPSCLTCNGVGPLMCTSCAAGEYLHGGSCYLCDSSCRTCNGAGPSVCTTCLAGKYHDTGSCLCDSSCQTCDGAGPSICTSCAAGKYLESGSCYLCDSSCLTCSGVGSSLCTSCATGKYLDSASCYLCDSSCQACDGAGPSMCTLCAAGKYLDNASCYLCDSSCLTCSGVGSSLCTSCAAGKYLDSASCYLCDSSCLTCDGAGSSLCTSCAAGKYLDSASCSLCDSSCLTCDGAGSSLCSSCAAGKYLDSASCYLCDSSCLTCSGAGSSLCTSCAAEKYLESGSCYLCDSSCLTCSGVGSSLCTSCATGKYLDSGSCLCDSSCQACDGAGPSMCTSCAAGKYLDSGFCYLCPSHCKTCNKTDNVMCTSCESLYNIELVDEIQVCKTESSLSHEEVEEIEKTAGSIQTTGKATSAGMKAASIINSNSPSSALLAGLSSMMQYIRYMKINFPPKVQKLFNVSAGNPISSSFGVSIPLVIKENLSDDPLPYAFDQYDINSNFVSNLWDFMVSLILMFLAILALTALKLITSKYRRINLVVSKTLQALKWNFPIMMVCGSSGEIVFFASLQLRSSPFTGLSSIICCIVSILMMILVVFLLTMAFKIARAIRKGKLNEAKKWIGFEILYVEYEEKSFFSLAYMFLFLSRNIIFNLTLATLFEYPLVECCIINAFNFMMVCYLIYLRPLKDLFALIQLWINEGLLNVLSICVLVVGILDYLELEQETTRNGLQDAILIAIKTFNFAALGFTVIGFLIFMRSASRIWKTGRAKGMKSPLQMFNFLFFGDNDEEKENEFSKKNLQIEKEFRENNQSTIDMKGDTSLVNLNIDTTIIQDTSMKILQTEFIQREQMTDFEMSPQLFFNPVENDKNLAEARKRRFKVKRRSNALANATGEINDSGLKNNDAKNEAENELWFLKFRKLKSRLNWNAQKTDLTIETNMTSFQ